MKKLKRNEFIADIVIVVVLLVSTLGYKVYKTHQYNEGLKEVIIELDAGDYNKIKAYKTDKNTLGELALEMEEEIVVTDGFVAGVFGFEPNMDNQEWLLLSVNNVPAITGIDEIILEDGQTIQLELKVGW